MFRLAAALLVLSTAIIAPAPARAQEVSLSRIYKLCIMEDPQCLPLFVGFRDHAQAMNCTEAQRAEKPGRMTHAQKLDYDFKMFGDMVHALSHVPGMYTRAQIETYYVKVDIGCTS